jgi:DNA-binding GntR family transcriptional regulator
MQTHRPGVMGTETGTVLIFKTVAEDALLRRIRGEYREMPGMRLTEEQAMRLWGLDRRTCREALDSLVTARFLARDHSGRFIKAHCGY